MKNIILEDIMKVCNNKEKILIKLFPNTYIKAYHIGRINTVNHILKK